LLDVESALLILGLVMSFVMAVSLGGNDAAEPTDCAVGAGVISIRKAVILFAIFTAVGALTQGFMVMKTVGRGIVPEISIAGAFTCVTAAALWVLLIASRIGIDISVTHSIIGAVVGYGLLSYGWNNINHYILFMTILSWITSPLTSIILAYVFYRIIVYIIERMNIDVYSPKFEKTLSAFLIGSLAFSAYSFGMNDIANATGVYVTIASKLGRMPDYNAMLALAAFGSVGIAVGGLTIGPKVISTMAFKVTRLNVISGFAAELSNALVVYLFTTIPYHLIGFGLPISTSLASAGSLIGVGIASGGRKSINKEIAFRLASFWVLTVPATMAISAVIYFLLKVLLHVV